VVIVAIVIRRYVVHVEEVIEFVIVASIIAIVVVVVVVVTCAIRLAHASSSTVFPIVVASARDVDVMPSSVHLLPRTSQQFVLPPIPVRIVTASTTVAYDKVHAGKCVERILIRCVPSPSSPPAAETLILDSGDAIVRAQCGDDRCALAIRFDLFVFFFFFRVHRGWEWRIIWRERACWCVWDDGETIMLLERMKRASDASYETMNGGM
jgi:hypothetical protein